MKQFYQVFFDETAEHLAAMESLLLSLDTGAPSVDDLNAIFRAAHSIKGGSGTFGFADMAEVTHDLESLLDRLRKQEIDLTAEMVDAFLAAGDVIQGQLAAHRGDGSGDEAAAASVSETLRQLAADAPPATARQPDATGRPAGDAAVVVVQAPAPAPRGKLLIAFRAGGGAPIDNLIATLAELGSLKVVTRAKSYEDGGAWEFHLSTCADPAAVRELVAFAVDANEFELAALESDAQYTRRPDPAYGFFDADPAPGLTASGGAAEADPANGFFEPLPVVAAATDPGYGFFDPMPDAIAAPDAVVARSPGRRSSDDPAIAVAKAGRRPGDKNAVGSSADASSIRVSVEKVDQLINLVGELVITQAMLAQSAGQAEAALHEKLIGGLNQLERNTRDLQEAVMSIRMMPIAFVFSRFPRLVRELAQKLGKQVELHTVGEATELDKGLIEKIADPLTHLVRNSLDHGLETPQARAAAGKPEVGTITLRAFHQGGNIVIEVADDGAGLPREKILAKARERGMPVSGELSDQEVWLLIFEAGFSTAEQVTDVSGRGFGMDVVKRNIQALGGRIEIDSTSGLGTRISIRLPLTLAILDGMSVALGGEILIVPLTCIRESLQPAEAEIRTVSGRGLVLHVRGEYLPVLELAKLFNVKAAAASFDRGIVLIVESGGVRVALAVDDLLGQHQVVIKSLETNYRRVPGISGATIMGDGRVALIVDVAALINMQRPERLAA
jgi:two-component system chemotaxis sensor kinase CheA